MFNLPDPGCLRAHLPEGQTEGREPLKLPNEAGVWQEGGGRGHSSGRAVVEAPKEALIAEAAQTKNKENRGNKENQGSKENRCSSLPKKRDQKAREPESF